VKKFNHMTVVLKGATADHNKQLETLGDEGWELVSAFPDRQGGTCCYFKREQGPEVQKTKLAEAK
jgi:hypothetical protein